MEYDVIVAGGGVVGLSCAYYLSKRGKKTLVLEKEDHASGSAGATDGVVSFHTKKPGDQLELAVRSITMFDTLSDELGEDIHFVKNCGGLQPAEDAAQFAMLSRIAEEQRAGGVDVRMIGGDEMRAVEPMLAGDLYGALYAPNGCKAEPIRLTMAFLHAARRLGAEIRNRTAVTGILKDGKGAVKGVTTDKGESFGAKAVVLACGSWSGEAGKLFGLRVPVTPRKGQLLVTEPVGPFMNCTLQCARYNQIKYMPESVTDPDIVRTGASLNIHQTAEGGLLIGGTREWEAFDRESTYETIARICARAVRFFPTLKDVSVIRAFAGLRPYTPDGLCLIGPTKALPGLFLATGHEGDGIALSPVTGKLAAEYIADGRTSFDASAFLPDRFDLR